jgi:hypothetical protein
MASATTRDEELLKNVGSGVMHPQFQHKLVCSDKKKLVSGEPINQNA